MRRTLIFSMSFEAMYAVLRSDR